MTIERNLSVLDMSLRLLGTIALAIIATFTGQLWLGIIACVIFISALSGFCPVYGMFGLRTCEDLD